MHARAITQGRAYSDIGYFWSIHAPLRDGWRTLRFLWIFSPRWLFLYPGLAISAIGLVSMAYLLPGPRRVGAINFDIHTLLYAGGGNQHRVPVDPVLDLRQDLWGAGGDCAIQPMVRSVLALFTVESSLIAGSMLLLIGLSIMVGVPLVNCGSPDV
jgi:hypothetical protein